MGEYLTWIQFGVVFVMLLIIQFITRTKGVADGMVIRQIMIDNDVEANNIIKDMKKIYDEEESLKN